MRERNEAGRDVLSFIAGAMFGAGLALLYAPKTGREVREKVTDFTNDAMAKMKGFSSEAQEKMKTTFSRGKEMAEEKAASFTSGSETMHH